jgi:ubiquinone biosynthesis monooxygenase Coq7
MQEQVEALTGIDDEAVRALREIIVEEQQHHDLSAARLPRRGVWPTIINPVVGVSTRVVIWLGMRL